MPKSEYHGARRSTIYALCDPETREIRYIGKTSRTLKQRLRQHLRDAEEGDKSRCSSYRLRWLRSLGAQPVIVSLLITSESFGIEMERATIKRFRELGYRLTNTTAGGEGNPGWCPPVEYRNRMSAVMKGKRHSEEARKNMRAAAKARGISEAARIAVTAHNKGRSLSPEHRAKLSAANKGKASRIGFKQSPEWVAGMRERMKGNKYSVGVSPSVETRVKIGAKSRARKRLQGYTLSAEHKAKISASLIGNTYSLGRHLTPEHKQAISRALLGSKKPRRSL